MKVLVVSGIWPPDVGGPASHAPEFSAFLLRRGHDVEVVTTAATAPEQEGYPVHWVNRRWPPGPRHLASVVAIARRAARSDVVYCTGMVGRAALSVSLARAPLVLKLTSDPAYERTLRYRLYTGALDDFQSAGGRRVAVLRRMRDFAIARADRIVCPSAALRDLAARWGVDRERITVLPNPVDPPVLDDRAELRRRHGFGGRTLVFAGRLAPQKSVDIALEALRELDQDISLVVAGDGPMRAELQRLSAELGLDGRVRFLGAQPRQTIFELLAAADAVVLSSSWENFPHVVVEALAVGTPVVSTETGGVREVLEHERNGLLVPPQDPEALAGAIRRYFADDALRARLRGEAVQSIERYSPERIYGELEQVLASVTR